MMNHIRRSGVSVKSRWLSVLNSSSHGGLQHMPSKSFCDVGFAEYSSLAAQRSLMSVFSKRVMKPGYGDINCFSTVANARQGNSILSREQWAKRALLHQSPLQLSKTGDNLRTSGFIRCFASKTTESSGRKESEARREISTVEDPFDAPTYNIPEKPVTFTEGASYSLVILAGLGIAAAAAYGVFSELIFQPKEYKIFNKALDRIQNDSQVRVRIGSPITGYGSESRNRAARQRIPHKTWTDEDGVEHITVNFHVRGPHGAGKVYSEMFKDKEDKQWKFMYLIVEVTSPSPAQLMLESYVPA